MSIVQPVLLGIVEGVTEFLPVSSTGHLVLAGALLGYDEQRWQLFDIVIQLGAILAVVVLYRRTFWTVGAGILRGEAGAIRFARNVAVAFLPAAVVGLALHRKIEALLGRPDVVAWALIAGGIAILAVERFARGHARPIHGVAALPLRTVLGIGVIQCLSMVPGVSRSGATIMGALAQGVERRTAAEFSFFLAVPTMLGATVVELAKNRHAIGAPGQASAAEIAIGFGVAFFVALAVVRGFVRLISRHGFAPFAWYRILAGTAALLLLAR